jgi:hypothetical protein
MLSMYLKQNILNEQLLYLMINVQNIIAIVIKIIEYKIYKNYQSHETMKQIMSLM